jgi:CRP/FNR family cyclic AMP-dependent transcriptional regulator
MSLFEPAGTAPTAGWGPASTFARSLIGLDPELGRFLPADRLAAAQREIPVRVVTLPRAPWPAERIVRANRTQIGVLVVEGLLGRELLADEAASMELVGPGDLIRPWDESGDPELLQATVRWNALAPTGLALLDHHVAGRLVNYPEIYCALLERCAHRTRRLAVLQTISQLNRVDRRVLALLWHLAERWGRVTPDGVLVPLALSHRMLGQLVGARRPTVSSALKDLAEAGDVTRGPGGTWLLTGAPVGAPAAQAAPFVPPRRAMLQSAV